jgi:O-methyltransferase involved in polyketide biosynthesis
MYLTRAGLADTLAAVGTLAEGTELVADHLLPRRMLGRDARWFVDSVMPGAAASREPWLSYLAPEEMLDLLHQHGFGSVRHIRQPDMVAAGLWERRDSLRPVGISVIVHAVVGRGTR